MTTTCLENGLSLFLGSRFSPLRRPDREEPGTPMALEAFFAARTSAAGDNGARYDQFYHPESIAREFFGRNHRRDRLWTRR